MSHENLKQRTKKFGLDVIMLVEKLSRDRASDVLARQLLRAATSVDANYRAACRAKSQADFIYKMSIVEEEADESGYWLEMLFDSRKATATSIEPLSREANELVAIAVSSIQTARNSSTKPTSPRSPNSALRTPHSALGR